MRLNKERNPISDDVNHKRTSGPLLIIGHSGQLATDLVNVATHHDYDVMAIGRPHYDLSDRDAPERMLSRVQPRAVINAGAYTHVDKAESEPDLAHALNATGPEMLARACARHEVPLIHLSTDQVFDGRKEGAYTEEDTPHPLCVYGRTKWEGEKRVLAQHPSALIVRVSWVYGPSGQNFVTKVLEWARHNSELSIVNDQVGRPTFSPDLACHLLTFAHQMAQKQKAPSGVLHLAGASVMSRYEQAQMILHESQKRGEAFAQLKGVPTSAFPTPATRPLNAVLDTSLAKQKWSIVGIDFHSGLIQTLDEMRGKP
jgi:dTDP-4-dehydrorhamnose reductase